MNGAGTIGLICEQSGLVPENQPFILLHPAMDDLEICEACPNMGFVINLYKPAKSKDLFQCLKSISDQAAGRIIHEIPKAQPVSVPVERVPVILIAEDEVLNMILVTELVRLMIPGVTILKAPNGRVAYELAISKQPDLILMDIQMPEMSGIEATVRIRNYEKTYGGHIPISALTAGFEKEKCLEARMD